MLRLVLIVVGSFVVGGAVAAFVAIRYHRAVAAPGEYREDEFQVWVWTWVGVWAVAGLFAAWRWPAGPQRSREATP